MSDTDPLLRAVSDGNPACPDGRALARLGELVRAASRPPRETDVAAAVRARLRADDTVAMSDDAPDFAGAEAEAIDALWNRDRPAGSGSGSELERLGGLIAALKPPAPVDLRAAVRARLNERRPDMPQLERGGRWRIWQAIIAGHVAAVLFIAMWSMAVHERERESGEGDGEGTDWIVAPTHKVEQRADRDRAPLLPSRLPAQWQEIPRLNADLFMLRRFPEMRDAAREHYGMAATREPVMRALAWLQAEQRPTGVFGELTGDADRDLATQSLATLALLGEGPGDATRAACAGHALGWIADRLAPGRMPEYGPVAAGIGSLALVEGALLLGDQGLRARAEFALAQLDRGVPPQPGAAGLGGFTLLAIETARQGGLAVPPRLIEQGRQKLAVPSAPRDSDVGRLGLAAFSRMIFGRRSDPSTARQLRALAAMTPAAANGQVDPLGWLFATLALREAGGDDWERWNGALQGALLPCFVDDGEGKGHVPAAKVHYAGANGEVFATSVATLDLQAAYRYLPLQSP
jgi:hypothetical protein